MAGLLAGVAVDVPLHPLDTVKTRMQATEGFDAAGGLRRRALFSHIQDRPGEAAFRRDGRRASDRTPHELGSDGVKKGF